MKKPDDIRVTAWQTIGNSPGLWIFVFAAFGLLSLSVGEGRIQKRMQRYHAQLESQQAAIRQSTKATSRSASPQSATATSSEIHTADRANTPYQYELAGLRWILGIAAVAGLGIMIFTACSHHSGSSGSRDAASL